MGLDCLRISLPQVICGFGGEGSQGDTGPLGQCRLSFAANSEFAGSCKSHRSWRDQLLSGAGPQTPEICPSNIATCVGNSDPPTTIFPKMRAQHWLRSVACTECSAPQRGRTGVAARRHATLGNLWVE